MPGGTPSAGGVKFRSYTAMFEQFLPAIKQAGLNDGEVRQLTVDNPAQAFPVRVRRTA